MNNEQIIKGVCECVTASLSLTGVTLTPTSLLVTDLNSDSLDIMDIMFLMEEKFDIKLEKEDFDFLKKIGMEREVAVVDGNLTVDALTRLKVYLPELDTALILKPADLAKYLSISSIVKLVQERLATK